jgi:DNA-binding NarL/FixJ family response regulator
MESVKKKPLTGRRLILVEDDPLVAIELDEIIRALGAEVVGPFGRVEPALAAIQRDSISGGVLDIRLDGETTFPIIDIFLDRADPILLVTGGDAADLPQQYRHVPRLQKPFDYAEFEYAARSIFRRSW